MNCNHCIGTWAEWDSSGLVYVNSWRKYEADIDERFDFCPDCGADIRTLKIPAKEKKPRKKRVGIKKADHVESFMEREAARFAPKILESLLRPSPFQSYLNATTPKESDPK